MISKTLKLIFILNLVFQIKCPGDKYQEELIQQMTEKKEDGTYLLYSLVYYNLYLNLQKFCLLNFELNHCDRFEQISLQLLEQEMKYDINHREEGHGLSDTHKNAKFKKFQGNEFYDVNTIFQQMFEIKPTYNKEYQNFLSEFFIVINSEQNKQIMDNIIESYHKSLQELSDYFTHEIQIEKEKILRQERI